MAERLPVIFARNYLPGSLLIQLFTWSRWSHVGILLPRNRGVLEAVAGKGVVVTPMCVFKRRYRHTQMATVPCDNLDETYTRAMSQRGSRYDYHALFGIFFRTGWNHLNHWICSELIGWASNMFRADRIARITPEDLWRISK